MASNQTQHLKLCQWEADDEVLRTDFNADNTKIDAAVAEAERKLNTIAAEAQWKLETAIAGVEQKLSAAVTAAQNTAQTALAVARAGYGPENRPFVVGTYTGNGADTQFISLGFTPSAVLVFYYNGATYDMNNSYSMYYGGLALKGFNLAQYPNELTAWKDGTTLLAIVDGGVQVAYRSESRVYLNDATTHYYIAFR